MIRYLFKNKNYFSNYWLCLLCCFLFYYYSINKRERKRERERESQIKLNQIIKRKKEKKNSFLHVHT